jgi:predicted kinase
MPDLTILVGLQASGKSTFYRQYLAKTHALISKDLLRNNKRPARRQVQLIRETLEAGRSAAIDNTNPTVELRKELIEIGREYAVTVVGYYFSARLADCLARNALRSGKERVPDVGLFSTVKALIRPSLAEGFDRLYYVTIGIDGAFVVSDWVEEGRGKDGE